MRYRAFVLFPLAWGALFLLGDALLYGQPGYPYFLRTQAELAKGLALGGSLAAAFALEPKEYLRRAWLLISGCMALLLLRDLTVAPLGFEALGTSNLTALRAVLVVAANLSQVVGTWMLARVGHKAGLGLPLSRAAQAGLVAVAVALSALIAGPGVVANARSVSNGDLSALGSLASSLGDAISLCLIAPVLLTALALRGGRIGWTWTLLTTSYVAWLFYDAMVVIGPRLGLEARGIRTSSELFRALGCTFGCTAGLAQRTVVEQLRRLRPGPVPRA